MKRKNKSMWICDWYVFYHEEVSISPSEVQRVLFFMCSRAAYGSQWPGLCLTIDTREMQRGRMWVCATVQAGGQPDNNKGPALSLSPVIFQLSEKLLWHWKKVKLKSLAWYVLTTACRLCNTSKYFLSSHSLWKGNSLRVQPQGRSLHQHVHRNFAYKWLFYYMKGKLLLKGQFRPTSTIYIFPLTSFNLLMDKRPVAGWDVNSEVVLLLSSWVDACLFLQSDADCVCSLTEGKQFLYHSQQDLWMILNSCFDFVVTFFPKVFGALWAPQAECDLHKLYQK